MKIALVLDRFSLTRGGAERSMYELACALHDLGADVTLVAAAVDTTGLDPLPFQTVTLAPRGPTARSYWRSYQRTLADHCAVARYDIVHSITPVSSADVYQPRAGSVVHGAQRHFAAYENQLKIFFKRLATHLNRRRSLHAQAERDLCRPADGPIIAGISQYVIDQFKALYDLPDERLCVIRNGVNVDPLRSDETRARARKLRQLYDPDGNKTIFLFAAENYHLKGLSWLLRSAAQAAAQDRDFQIMVFGEKNYELYYRQAQRFGLTGRVLFMGRTSQMPAVLQMCDAVVLPTFNDACSRIVMEGLAADKPAITTAVNGAAEFLNHGKYGIVIEGCSDVPTLSRALLDLCDPTRRRHLTAAIEADHVYQRVSITRHARELMSLYQQIIAARK